MEHRWLVVSVPNSTETDYLYVCCCGFLSLPHESPEPKEPCPVATLERENDKHWNQYGEALLQKVLRFNHLQALPSVFRGAK